MIAASSSLLFLGRCRSAVALTTVRTYISRAHPKPRTVVSVHTALDQVLEGIDERRKQREENWVLRAEQRMKKGIKVSGVGTCRYATDNSNAQNA